MEFDGFGHTSKYKAAVVTSRKSLHAKGKFAQKKILNKDECRKNAKIQWEEQ